MYKIATLNKISPKGLDLLSDQYSIVEDINEATGILVRSQDMKTMEFSENLRAIARAGAGTNNIPVSRCSEQGIVVFNTPGANANAVKELVITGILMSSRNLFRAIEWTKSLTEDIPKAVEKNKSQFAGHEIKGKTLGVIGLGSIGVMVANTAEALGMNVIGYDPYISVHSAHELSSTVGVFEALDAVLPKCDYVTIHVPFMDQTKELINDKRIATMKDHICVLNFSRDQIVNDDDMLRAIENGKVRKYVTDFPTDKYVGVENVVCIPHLGASTKESEENCAKMAVNEMMDYIENGNISNSVNFPNCTLGICTEAARICILNKNIPAVLGKITGILAEMNINISDLLNRSKGEYACTLVDVDSAVDEKRLRQAMNLEGIISIRVIA